MNFRIADTFTDSLAKLTGEEQKADGFSGRMTEVRRRQQTPGTELVQVLLFILFVSMGVHS
jgi:hypothetical protein